MAGARGPITEGRRLVGADATMEYGRSKAMATAAVLAASSPGFETIAVYPTAIMGPYDYRASSWALWSSFAAGRLPAYIDGGFDFVDIRDVSRGAMLAAR